MADYRQVMTLLLQGYPYRQIESMAGCSHRTIAKAARVLDEEVLSTPEQVEALSVEELDRLFADGRKNAAGQFVPVDIDKVVKARLGRKKPPLKVLWARYLACEAPVGVRHYGYERFCQIVTSHVRANDLVMPISHVPGHTMQVDWAGTRMSLVDPVTQKATAVSVFVASLPYSGMVFAYGCLDERQLAWCQAHRRAFEYFGGVSQVIVPDNASTASNRISKTEAAREVNREYAEFLEYYRTAAVPTRSAAPRDKGHVEAGVKVVTNWVIHFLADRRFADLDELNDAVGQQVGAINERTPFRGEPRSRRAWFDEAEAGELLDLPAQPWRPVVWRKAKVNRDWHIQIESIKYSVPHRFAGTSVDVRIIGSQLSVLAEGEVIATHQQGAVRNSYVTNTAHAPAHYEQMRGLWTRGYFLRQGAKVGPGCVDALTRLLDAKVIEAQGFRSAMNILDLGKRGNRHLLEAACQQLVTDPHRPISYTAVKHRLTALRAQDNQRPTTTDGNNIPATAPGTGAGRPTSRDTSRAHLDGAGAFSLDTLTRSSPTSDQDETTGAHDA